MLFDGMKIENLVCEKNSLRIKALNIETVVNFTNNRYAGLWLLSYNDLNHFPSFATYKETSSTLLTYSFGKRKYTLECLLVK